MSLEMPEGATVHPDDEVDHTHCPADGCGAPLVFDPDMVGDTVGGMTRRGWLACKACGKAWITRRGREVENWRVASSGRSVETSVGRIRVDGGHDPAALCARIVKLPDLEVEVERLRRRVAELETIR